jgi:quinol monooxygenase YgiN
MAGQYVCVAEVEIDPAQLEQFKAAARENIETAIRVQPGVLVLYAVSDKDNPNRIIVFEIYSDESAFKAQLETPHFKKFQTATVNMVKSHKFIETVPLILGAKPPGR